MSPWAVRQPVCLTWPAKLLGQMGSAGQQTPLLMLICIWSSAVTAPGIDASESPVPLPILETCPKP